MHFPAILSSSLVPLSTSRRFVATCAQSGDIRLHWTDFADAAYMRHGRPAGARHEIADSTACAMTHQAERWGLKKKRRKTSSRCLCVLSFDWRYQALRFTTADIDAHDAISGSHWRTGGACVMTFPLLRRLARQGGRCQSRIDIRQQWDRTSRTHDEGSVHGRPEEAAHIFSAIALCRRTTAPPDCYYLHFATDSACFDADDDDGRRFMRPPLQLPTFMHAFAQFLPQQPFFYFAATRNFSAPPRRA